MMKENTFLVKDSTLPFTAFINTGDDSAVHWHTYVELLFVICGRANVVINGDVYTIAADDFMIINSMDPHFAKFDKSVHSEILVIQFEPNVINPNIGSLFELDYILPFLQKEAIYSKWLNLRDDLQLKSLLTGCLDEFAAKEPGYELSINGTIYLIFSWLKRKHHLNIQTNADLPDKDLLRLKNIFKHVESTYKEEISLTQIAEMAHMSYAYFCRFFKKTTGRTFIDYLNFIRLSKAEVLLVTTDMSITQIALEVGFKNVNYFDRLFKSEKKQTPLSYRKQHVH